MVYSGDREGVRELVMAMGTERSKPPLHNFNLPCLKWGNQRHLRCMKVSDSAVIKDKNLSSGISADRLRSSRSPPNKIVVTRDYEIRRFKRVKPSGGVEEGIAAVRERLMSDFKAAADKLKDTILRKRVSEEFDDDEAAQAYKEEDEDQSPPPPPSLAVVVDAKQESRPWNLRKRRAACKAPVTGNSVSGKGLKTEEKSSPMRSEGAKSPRLRGEKRKKGEEKEKETERERAKFAVALSKKEIEEDFMVMLGHRPARRPKKRPRNVQKQLDTLFPGLWLTEVNVDTYKVPELPDNGKR